MNISALIPARLGSKRLQEKNIKLLNDKPLLFWSIDAALDAGVFERIYVSTESDKIADLVRNHYSHPEVEIVRRPADLSSDSADLNDVCKHLLNIVPDIEILSLMMPTYPFRSPQRILEEIIPPIYSRQIDRVVSVRPGNYSTFDYWIRLNDDSYMRMYARNPLWCGAGNAAYCFQKREYFFLPPHKWPHLIGERTLRIQTNYKESLDIDTEADFYDAQKICSGYCPHHRRLHVEENNMFEWISPHGSDLRSFERFLDTKGIRQDLPILILKPANPLFTFLRWYECNSSRSYIEEHTNDIIAKLPKSGHSQDFPLHYIHSPHYRVLRKEKDQNGILDSIIPASQIVFEEELKKEWPEYIDPIEWKTVHNN